MPGDCIFCTLKKREDMPPICHRLWAAVFLRSEIKIFFAHRGALRRASFPERLPLVPARPACHAPTNAKNPLSHLSEVPRKSVIYLGIFGSGGRDRTYDQLINSQLLYR